MANNKQHAYTIKLEWTGNLGSGTDAYRSFSRDHEIGGPGKPPIPGSSGLGPRGDAHRYNPEELLASAIASGHMLWYLHLCVGENVIVTHYTDEGTAVLLEAINGPGHISEIILRPKVVIEAGSDIELAQSLHQKARQMCYVANSVNFPVRCTPTVIIEHQQAMHEA